MNLVQIFLPLCVVASAIAAATKNQRSSRSLEDDGYLPPDAKHPQVAVDLIPPNCRGYLPPAENEISQAPAAKDEKDPLQLRLDVRPIHHDEHLQPFPQENGLSIAPVQEEAHANDGPLHVDEEEAVSYVDGYFYPKPMKAFSLPSEVKQEQPVSQEATNITESNERKARSPRKTRLLTNPDDGPVRISTLPFQVTKIQDRDQTIKVRRSEREISKFDLARL